MWKWWIQMWTRCCASRNRQQENIELIASENFTSPAVMEAGSVLTNKYAEGYPENVGTVAANTWT